VVYEEINSKAYEREASVNKFRLSPHQQREIIKLINLQFPF
jgi:ribosomal protein L22